MKQKIITLLYVAVCINNTLAAQSTERPDSTAKALQEVVITARQPATRLEGNTLVSTITGSALKDAGSALDVLAQLPLITVKDNSVEIYGKSNLEIFVNGRPLHDNDELQLIQSQDIKRVELLLAPGAIYESTTGAVLKIITKQKFMKGISATAGTTTEKKRQLSNMEHFDTNYHTGNMDFFLSGSFNHSANRTKGRTTNYLEYKNTPTTIGSRQNSCHQANTYTAKAGFNFSGRVLSFGAYYRLNPEHGDMTNNGTEWINSESEIGRYINRCMSAHNHLVSIYYDNTSAEKYHWHFDGNFRHSSSGTDVATVYPHASIDDVNSSEHKNATLWAGKLYTDFPLIKGSFTTGAQISHTRTSLDFKMLNDDIATYIPSSVSETRQTTAALFASWSRIIGKVNISAGLRYEFTDFDFSINGMHDNDLSRRSNILTPDISAGYSFNESSQISLSYKAVTVKPGYSQLTSGLSYTGRYETEGGNPSLRDEKMHDIRLFGTWHDFIIQADFTRSNDSYGFVKQMSTPQTLRLTMRPVNIDVSALSIYLIWNKSLKRWRPGITLGMYRQWLDIEGTSHNKPILSYFLDNTITLPRNTLITANICGQTCGDMHTNRFGNTLLTMDASISKMLLNKALTVRLSVKDIFNTANNDWTMNTYGIFVDKRQTYDRRGISLSVTYRFQPRKEKYKGENAAEEEMKRL